MPVRLRVEKRAADAALRGAVRRRAEAMLALLQLEKSELSLVLSTDEQIHELNKNYRGKDRPTDVLAFPMREGDFGRFHAGLPSGLLGDVIVSVPTAERQARAAKRGLLSEVTMLVAHGLLHLLGWDHETRVKDVKMRAETDRLVAAAEASEVPRATQASRTRKQKPHKRST